MSASYLSRATLCYVPYLPYVYPLIYASAWIETQNTTCAVYLQSISVSHKNDPSTSALSLALWVKEWQWQYSAWNIM